MKYILLSCFVCSDASICLLSHQNMGCFDVHFYFFYDVLVVAIAGVALRILFVAEFLFPECMRQLQVHATQEIQTHTLSPLLQFVQALHM